MKRELRLLLFLSTQLEWEIVVFFTIHNTFAVAQQPTVFSQVMVSGYISTGLIYILCLSVCLQKRLYLACLWHFIN